MAFLHPWLLLGLAAAAIPILLHLRQQQEPPTVRFPAVRYLLDATRQHERRLRLRHWLLLALRTLLVIALVLAAAGPSFPVGGVATHPPTALALVLDNSLSSGAVAGGTLRLDRLREGAREILATATPSDALWLITADGVPRRGSPGELRAIIDTLTPSPRRLDLGAAMTIAGEIVERDERSGGVVVLTDLQESAVTPAEVRVPVMVVADDQEPISDLGIAALDVGAQPWGLDGARLSVEATGDPTRRAPVRIQVGNRPPRDALLGVGAPANFVLPPLRPGWYEVRAELEADELRGDDVRSAGVRVAPVAAARWDDAGRYAGAALETLRENGRVGRGTEVTVGALGPSASIVTPPVEAARLGALNRALEQRGVTWRFGVEITTAATTDSGAWLGRVDVVRRHRLVPTGSGTVGVLATVGGEPWVVRSGDVVLIGSRLEPEWTGLPYSAAFVPFIDALVNRVARGEIAAVTGSVGAPAFLPDAVTEVVRGTSRWRVEGGSGFVANELGVHWLLNGADTVGALNVGADPRESLLVPAGSGVVEELWGARVTGIEGAGRAAFALAARSDLRGLLLWVALIAGILELVVVAWGRRRG
jgi:hypothetical protein